MSVNKQIYSHLFFDLDRTLWDFETNSIQAFKIIFEKRNLSSVFPCFDIFIKCYNYHNDALWGLYRKGLVTKDKLKTERFVLSLQDFDCNDTELAKILAQDYVEISLEQTVLFPGTIETLTYLAKKYKMHIITNGFIEEQYKKIKNSGLYVFFDRVITSEQARVSKPKPEIFHLAISSANAKKIESLMIGDDLHNDILGAKRYGIDQVYFNPQFFKHQETPTHEISSITSLMSIL